MPTVLIAGGTGLVGLRLSQMLRDKNYEVIHLSRSKKQDASYDMYLWDLEKQTIDEEALFAADYIINLAGAGVADKRWSTDRKKMIISSRTKSNLLLKNALLKIGKKPKAYLSASAIGYYGNSNGKVFTEADPPGEDFLSETCVLWENAIKDFADAVAMRTVIIRVGIVFSTKGGSLEKLLLPFNFGMANYFGDGSDHYSWIHIDDICNQFIFAMENEKMQGVYNGVGPQAATTKTIAKSIKAAKGSAALLLPVPNFALKLALGEMASIVISDMNVSGKKIQAAGYQYLFPDLTEALKDLLERKV